MCVCCVCCVLRVACHVAQAGSVGLNLTAANHVLFLSPCLDAGRRRQAIGRAHRIGQTRSVFVKTFVHAGTVEEKAAALLAQPQELPPREVSNPAGTGDACFR